MGWREVEWHKNNKGTQAASIWYVSGAEASKRWKKKPINEEILFLTVGWMAVVSLQLFVNDVYANVRTEGD